MFLAYLRGAVLLVFLAVSSSATLLAADDLGATAAAGAPECQAGLVGAWTGMLELDRLFSLRLRVDETSTGSLVAKIESGGNTVDVPTWRQGERIRFQPTALPVAFDLRKSTDAGALDGFINYGGHLVHVRIPRETRGSWSFEWKYLDTDEDRARIDLYVEEGDGGRLDGYFFFRDPRLPALYGEGLSCEDGVVTIRERNLGLRFTGRAAVTSDTLSLLVSVLDEDVPITFRRMPSEDVPDAPDASLVPPRPREKSSYTEHAPERVDDGWRTATPSQVGLNPDSIASLVASIVDGRMTATHAVLVARRGRLVVEEYFYGFDKKTLHDLRSASKTLASLLVGLAIRDGAIEDASVTALSLFPYRQYANWDPRKARITLRDLMTMSSGLDADDHDSDSPAAEHAYQSRDEDWVKTALDAPMIADPGAQPLYGSANPLILGGVLASALDEPVEWFADRTLFAPLGISDYRWFTTSTGGPYLGGGLYLRPRDLLKIGQLYLDGGVWRGDRLLPQSWVRDSWGRYGRLAPLDLNGNDYGYLWWHHEYEVDGESVRTVEARGYGGQYLFVVPALDLVVVVTAGNYRNGRTRQSQRVLDEFLLPAVR